MAEINDRQAVGNSNERVRPLCDQIATTIRLIKVYQAYRAAKGLDALYPNDPNAVIVDGSGDDGRTPISGADVVAFHALIDGMTASFDAGGGGAQNLVLKIAVNPR